MLGRLGAHWLRELTVDPRLCWALQAVQCDRSAGSWGAAAACACAAGRTCCARPAHPPPALVPGYRPSVRASVDVSECPRTAIGEEGAPCGLGGACNAERNLTCCENIHFLGGLTSVKVGCLAAPPIAATYCCNDAQFEAWVEDALPPLPFSRRRRRCCCCCCRRRRCCCRRSSAATPPCWPVRRRCPPCGCVCRCLLHIFPRTQQLPF